MKPMTPKEREQALEIVRLHAIIERKDRQIAKLKSNEPPKPRPHWLPARITP